MLQKFPFFLPLSINTFLHRLFMEQLACVKNLTILYPWTEGQEKKANRPLKFAQLGKCFFLTGEIVFRNWRNFSTGFRHFSFRNRKVCLYLKRFNKNGAL